MPAQDTEEELGLGTATVEPPAAIPRPELSPEPTVIDPAGVRVETSGDEVLGQLGVEETFYSGEETNQVREFLGEPKIIAEEDMDDFFGPPEAYADSGEDPLAGFSVVSPEDLVQTAQEKINNFTMPNNAEFDAYWDDRESKGRIQRAKETASAIPGGIGEFGKQLGVAAKETALAVPGTVGAFFGLDTNLPTAVEAGVTLAETGARLPSELVALGMDMWGGGKNLMADAPVLGADDDERKEIFKRLLKERMERRYDITPQEGESLVGGVRGVMKTEGLRGIFDSGPTSNEDRQLLKIVHDQVAEQVNAEMLPGLQLVSDVALTMGVMRGARAAGGVLSKKSTLAGSRLAKPSAPSQAITQILDGPKAARPAQKMDAVVGGAARKRLRKPSENPGSYKDMTPVQKGLNAMRDSNAPLSEGVASQVISGATKLIPAAARPALGAALAPTLATAKVAAWSVDGLLRGGYKGWQWTGKMAAPAVNFAKATKLKLDHGFGASNIETFRKIAADTSTPMWARRAAAEAAYLQATRGQRFLKETGSLALIEAGEEGIQEFLSVGSTPESVGQAIGGGFVGGAAIGPAFRQDKSRNLDVHLQDLDALYFRDGMAKMGDDPKVFDSLDPQARRDVAAIQGILDPESLPIRLLTGNKFGQLTNNPSAQKFADGAFLTKNNEIVLNMDRLKANPQKMLETLSHEIGHAVYKGLPQETRQSWHEAAMEIYGDDVIETFRKDYGAAVGQDVSTDRALDELFAEHFLGYNGTGGKLLTNKKSADGISIPGKRKLRHIKDAVLKKLGIDGTSPDGMLEFTPFKHSPDLETFIKDSLGEVGKPLERIPMPTKEQAQRTKVEQSSAQPLTEQEVQAAIDRFDRNAPQNLSEESAQAVSDAIEKEGAGVVDLPNGKQVIPTSITDEGNITYVDADELSERMRDVEESSMSDFEKIRNAVVLAKSSKNKERTTFVQRPETLKAKIADVDSRIARVEKQAQRIKSGEAAFAGSVKPTTTLKKLQAERADLVAKLKEPGRNEFYKWRDLQQELNLNYADFVKQTNEILNEIEQSAEPEQFEGGENPLSPRRDSLSNRKPGVLVSAARGTDGVGSAADLGTDQIPGSREDRKTRERQIKDLRKVAPPLTSEAQQRAVLSKDSPYNGAEHTVHIDPTSDRVIKVWNQWYEGGDTPYAYLRRLELANSHFDDDLIVEGIDSDGGIVTSQPYRIAQNPDAPHPTEQQIQDYMAGKGFWAREANSFGHDSGIEVSDARPANWIQTPEGPRMVDALITEGEPISLENQIRDDDPFGDIVDDVSDTETFDADDDFGLYRPADDAGYMRAVESGDTDTAQRMVDEAAKAAGVNTDMPLFHKTWSQFNQFKVGNDVRTWDVDGAKRTLKGESGNAFFFSPDPNNTPAYHNAKNTGERVLRVYGEMKNPMVVDKDTKEWARVVFAEGNTQFPQIMTDETINNLKEEGYDSVYFYSGDRTPADGQPNEVILLNPNQIKSADPVTYDDAGNVIPLSERFNTGTDDIRFSPGQDLPPTSQPENQPVQGRLSEEQANVIQELQDHYDSKTPERMKVLRADAIDSLSSRLVNLGIPVKDASVMARDTFKELHAKTKGASQIISGMGVSDLARMAGTGRPSVATRDHINPNWLTSAFESFANDIDLSLMKAQQVAGAESKVRQVTPEQGEEFVIGEKAADTKAFGSSLREDPNAPPRVYSSVTEGQKFGAQGNYNVFFEWDQKTTPIVATSHHHYGVANGITGIHASANVGDKNARSFGNPESENYTTLPSGRKVLDTHLLVGNAGASTARAHQLTVAIPQNGLNNVKKAYKAGGLDAAKAELKKVTSNELIGKPSQGKTKGFTSEEGIPPTVAIQRNRTEAYILNPDLDNVKSVTIVSNKPDEVKRLKNNITKAFQNNGTEVPTIKVVSKDSGPSRNKGRKAITDEHYKLTGEVRFSPGDKSRPDTDTESAADLGSSQIASPMRVISAGDEDDNLGQSF